jgi:hypothetical protein
MAGKEPTARQYRAEDTTPTPWAEARERLADADTYWLWPLSNYPSRLLEAILASLRTRKRPERRVGHAPALCGAGRKRTT